ncbi:MAG: hypothetical protein B7X03_01080 [Parcubacteria group bacterium 21-58-10]|nr:MAG: hypothetical protein B7X03_01080 [Parcubacteria group bacterium 21-58-10]
MNDTREKRNEIVWVYGGSAAGKETFIKFISEQHPQKLLESLRWGNKQIVPCTESMEWVAQYEGDPKGPLRAEIPNVVVGLNSQNTNVVILVKGQDLDLEADRPRKLKTLLPEDRHRIIYIDTNIDEVFKRLQRKPWWEDSFTKEEAQQWLDHQHELLRGLRDEFEITAVDGSTKGAYKIVDQPV